MPTGASAGSSMIPSEVSDNPSSFAEHNMPKDSTPRSFAAVMALSPGSFAPTVASAVFNPARAFAAPQTICSSSPLPPARTLHTCSLSACGWRAASTISATTTPSNGGAAVSMASSSKPDMVRREPSSFPLQGTSTRLRSQESGMRINPP